MIEYLYNEISSGLPDVRQLVSLVVRLVIAMVLGAIVGLQRERKGKPAGLRTHMLVALGATLFVVAALEFGLDSDGLSRVIQGLVTGIGFIGAGAILKLQEKREVEGLTTAAGIWMIAAVGVAVGLGRIGLALVSTILTWITLGWVSKLESHIDRKRGAEEEEHEAL